MKKIVTFSVFVSLISEGGEKVDIEKLYHDYFSIVYKYILSMSGDPLVAEEITQETFFKALKKIDDFRGESTVKSWLCQIAKNTFYDYAKIQGRHTELLEEYEEFSTSIEDAFITKDDSKAIHRILHHLKEPYKEVFSLRTFGELSFSDIAELFGKTDSWARVTFHRARLMIREEMENGK